MSLDYQIGRPSVLDDAKRPLDDENDVPMLDDDSENLLPADDDIIGPDRTLGRDSSGLDLSLSRDDTAGSGRRVSIGGLDSASSEEEEEEERAPVKNKPKARKRRKIAINDRTELKSADIRSSLEDTSDVVRDDILHPATWAEGQDAVSFKQTDAELLLYNIPYDKQFTRPTLGDDGNLAPVLLQLFARNAASALGKELDYELEEPGDEEEVEVARGRNAGNDEDGEQPIDGDDEVPMMQDDDIPPMEDDDDMAPEIDDEIAMNNRDSGLGDDLNLMSKL